MATSFSYRDNLSNSSDNDSDSESEVWKRGTKSNTVSEGKPIFAKPCEAVSNITTSNGIKQRKINNIWSDVALENDMTDNIGGVGLNEKPESSQDRSSESYDFTRRELDTRPFPEDEIIMDSDGSHVKNSPIHSKSRATHIQLNKNDAKIAKRICWKLSEPKKYLIYRVVGVIGVEKSLEFLKRTEEIEESGGMLVKNSSRRRSPGGVFLTLLKTDDFITKEQVDKIFEGESEDFALMKAKRKLLKEAKKAFDIKGGSHLNKKKRKFNKIKPRFQKSIAMETSDDFPLIPESFFNENVEIKNNEKQQVETKHEEHSLSVSDVSDHKNSNSEVEDGEITD